MTIRNRPASDKMAAYAADLADHAAHILSLRLAEAEALAAGSATVRYPATDKDVTLVLPYGQDGELVRQLAKSDAARAHMRALIDQLQSLDLAAYDVARRVIDNLRPRYGHLADLIPAVRHAIEANNR